MTTDSDDYLAVSISPQTYTLKDVLDYMTREGLVGGQYAVAAGGSRDA